MRAKLSSPAKIGRIGRVNIATSHFTVHELSPALWLDASDLSTITQSGGAVSQWSDKSGNGRHATQTTGSAQPATGIATMNGRNVLSFSSVNTNTLNFSSIPQAYLGFTLFYAANPDIASQPATYRDHVKINGVGTGSQRQPLIYANKNYPRMVVSAGAVDGTFFTNPGVNDTAAPDIFVVAWKTAEELFRKQSGYAFFSSGTPVLAQVPEGVSSQLGSVGTIAEVIFFSRKLAASEINLVGRYLASKWSIAWTDI